MAQAEVESTMIAAVDVEMIQFMPKSQDDMLKPLEEFNKDRKKFAAWGSNGDVFEAFVQQVLVPQLKTGYVVVMDNLSRRIVVLVVIDQEVSAVDLKDCLTLRRQ